MSEFFDKELVTWATVSSWSCFSWLYRASPSLAAKNIINLISVDHLVMPICRVFSCVVGRVCLLWPVRSLSKTLLAFALLCSVLQGKIFLLLQVSLDFLLLYSYPLWWKWHLFWVLVLKGLVSLHRTIQLQLLQNYLLGIDLDYCDTEWFALETNRGHCHFWDCTQALHFRLLLTTRTTPFLLRDSCP